MLNRDCHSRRPRPGLCNQRTPPSRLDGIMQPRKRFSLSLFLLLFDITGTSSASVARFLEKLLSKLARDETTRKGTRSFHPSYKRTLVPLSLISPSVSEEYVSNLRLEVKSPKQISEFLLSNPPQNCLESGGSIATHSTSTARPSSLHSHPRHRARVGSSASPGTIGVISVHWGHVPRGIIDCIGHGPLLCLAVISCDSLVIVLCPFVGF